MENNKKDSITDDLKQTDLKIENLSARKLDYGRNVELLKRSIEKELLTIGRKGEVNVLCELINISDDNWRNAIEGYLNKQKFYLIVEPENFEYCSKCFMKKMRKNNGLYGGGDCEHC